MPWNVERVVHLHRRAGFAATWDRTITDVQAGPEAAIERVLPLVTNDEPSLVSFRNSHQFDTRLTCRSAINRPLTAPSSDLRIVESSLLTERRFNGALLCNSGRGCFQSSLHDAIVNDFDKQVICLSC